MTCNTHDTRKTRSLATDATAMTLLRALGVLALLVLSGCSVLDLLDPPTFELSDNDRPCRVDDDCADVSVLSERGTLVSGSDPDGPDGPLPACLNVVLECNTDRGVCEAAVRVRDGDQDGAYDPNCPGFPFPPLLEDCDDSKPELVGRDSDGDGQVSTLCVRDPGQDCDDTLASVFEGATVEVCDGLISDCAMRVEGEDPRRLEEDMDQDGFASPTADCEALTASGVAASRPKTDCDDTNPFIFPGAPEVCDGVIDNCDEGSGPRANEDNDGDGFALPDANCEDSEAFPMTDCDESTEGGRGAATYPGAPEICDRWYNDCTQGTGLREEEDRDNDGLASFDADCEPASIPYGDCIEGGDRDPTTRYCPFLEQVPALDDRLEGASSVAFLDFTGDGLPDVLAASASSGAAQIYTQQADGSFPRSNFVFSTNTRALRHGPVLGSAVDPLGNPVEDLIVVSESLGSVTLVCNNGTNAPVATLVTSLSGARDATAFQLSGSTYGVVSVSSLSSSFTVSLPAFVGTPRCAATPTFNNSSFVLPGGDRPLAVTAGNFLSGLSGAEDIAVATMAGDVYLVRNQNGTTGGLSLEATPIATGVAGVLSATHGDFDGDGREDIALGTTTGITALMNLTGSAGGFSAVEVSGDVVNVGSLHARDLDFNGRDELVSTSKSEDRVDWWEYTDRGQGFAWLGHNLVSDFNDAEAAVTGDMDNDGDLDIVGAASGADTVAWWRTQISSNTGFESAEVDRAFDAGTDAAAANINGDSRQDMVAIGQNLASWWSLTSVEGLPSFQEVKIDDVSNGRALVAGDVNQDGRTDVVLADDAGVRAMINSDEGATWTASVLAGTTGVIDLALGDINADGRTDIVTLTATSLQYWINSGEATPTFTSNAVSALTNATSVAVGDTNGDGVLEIVVSSNVSPLQVFTRSSVQNAFTPTSLPSGVAAATVSLGDLNQDGALEILSGDRNLATPTLAYWQWDGASAYVLHVVSTASFVRSPALLRFTDVDSDGDLDIYGTFTGVASVAWLENTNGNDQSWIRHVVAEGRSGTALASGDFDENGTLDLLVAFGADAEIKLFKNDGVAWWRPSGR